MDSLLDHFLENGWIVFDLMDPAPIYSGRKLLEMHLQSLTGKKISLEQYHEFAADDETHFDLQSKMTSYFRSEKIAKNVITKQLPFFKQLVGIDLLVQSNPYLRMARPGKKQDNVGYHRDTFYGGSPYEISVILPFVECDSDMTLKVMPGSHVFPESRFSVASQISSDVVKGSEKHKLGFLYAPKVMDPEIEKDMVSIPLQLGQVLCFSLAIVHGCVINNGSKTRWTSDVRLLNALAPVDLRERPDYYEVCSSSPITCSADSYFRANEE